MEKITTDVPPLAELRAGLFTMFIKKARCKR